MRDAFWTDEVVHIASCLSQGLSVSRTVSGISRISASSHRVIMIIVTSGKSDNDKTRLLFNKRCSDGNRRKVFRRMQLPPSVVLSLGKVKGKRDHRRQQTTPDCTRKPPTNWNADKNERGANDRGVSVLDQGST